MPHRRHKVLKGCCFWITHSQIRRIWNREVSALACPIPNKNRKNTIDKNSKYNFVVQFNLVIFLVYNAFPLPTFLWKKETKPQKLFNYWIKMSINNDTDKLTVVYLSCTTIWAASLNVISQWLQLLYHLLSGNSAPPDSIQIFGLQFKKYDKRIKPPLLSNLLTSNSGVLFIKIFQTLGDTQ